MAVSEKGCCVAGLPIDWRRPFFADLAQVGAVVELRVANGLTVSGALQAANGVPVSFVPQSALPSDQAYEQFIFNTGTVPTRDNLHDFFNGLCSCTFLKPKNA